MSMLEEARARAERSKLRSPMPPPASTAVNMNSPFFAEEVVGPAVHTKDAAKLAREDWKLNFSKVSSKEVHNRERPCAPRWVPDMEFNSCCGCGEKFDILRRRHHCRFCGLLFCADCTKFKSLIPQGEAVKDTQTSNPRKVCGSCNEKLAPLQAVLSSTESNSARFNTTTQANRLINSPVRFSMRAEIRKAAYIIKNLQSGMESMGDDRCVRLVL